MAMTCTFCAAGIPCGSMLLAHVKIYGRVQGVRYRIYTQEEAQRRKVVGWVKNCSDGSVEAQFMGDREQLEGIITWCRQGPPAARVDKVTVDWLESDSAASDFVIC